MQSGASKTALLVAGYRARASAKSGAVSPVYPVCDDPWAGALAGDEGMRLAARFDEAFAAGELWVGLRTWFFDRQVRRFVEEGVAQIVILGAGLDTRAARLAQRGVTFFEVDHPASQADRLERLRRVEGYPPNVAIAVACDFEHQDFLDRLASHGFRTDAPALFVWEGVTYYLSEAAVRATLRRIATGTEPTSVVAFDLVRDKLVQGAVRDPADREASAVVADLGEPLRFGINDVLPLLYSEGFAHVRSVSFDEICLERTGTYERARKFRFQHVALASRARSITA